MNFKSPAHAACVFVFDGADNVLTVTRRNTDILSLPGGKVDAGETAQKAAVRECWEETGIVLDTHLMIPVYSEIVVGDDGVDYYSTAFVYSERKLADYPKEWVVESGIEVRFASVFDLLEGAFAKFNTRALKCIGNLRKNGA